MFTELDNLDFILYLIILNRINNLLVYININKIYIYIYIVILINNKSYKRKTIFL